MARKKTATAPTFDETTIRIRMYRVGFGDCFLVSLPLAGNNADSHAHILVDCGVHANGDLDMIDTAVDHIEETTNKNLSVIIATHSHQDHISGFSSKFSKFKIGEVWLPWCENLSDKQAAALQKKHATLALQLQDHFAAAPKPAVDDDERQAAIAAVANLVPNKTAMTLLRTGFGVNALVRYLEAGLTLKNPANVSGLSVRVLGPPRDQKFLSKMDPPAGQRYLRATGGRVEAVNDLKPFAQRWRLESSDAALAHLRLSREEKKNFQDQLVEASLNGLAFALDQAKNNTSLATILTFRGQNLLFPGDAQYGNWKSWLDQDDAEAILSSITFFKVAHHGSHNATPKDALERMTTGNFAAMVSTQNVPWDSIPRLPLMTRLGEQTENRVVRSDSLALKDRPKAPRGPALKTLPAGFQQGDFWYDYLIKL
jgi:beta-lactamase superfamily II metal-dependent hydrolase